MYQYKIDSLSVGSHEDSSFKEGRVIKAKLTLPSSMPLFWNSRISLFREGGLTPYNLGSAVGNLYLTPESGLSEGIVPLKGDPTSTLCQLEFSFQVGTESLGGILNGESIVPPQSRPVNGCTITLRMGVLPPTLEDQRIIFRVEGECTESGLHTHTAWCIVLIRKESLGGILLRWIII